MLADTEECLWGYPGLGRADQRRPGQNKVRPRALCLVRPGCYRSIYLPDLPHLTGFSDQEIYF